MASSILALIFASFLFCSSVDANYRRNFLIQESEAEADSIANTKYRTAYHFQPLHNWINDPNGPMYYNGIYHLFYQYNPYAAIWGNITWGHSISTDLIHWTGLEFALNPSDPFDINGCWTGSATILPGSKPVIIYTGIDTKNRQVQNFAYPKNLSDPFLREWIKPGYNPIIEPVSGLNSSQFRDPTTAWLGQDGLWRIAIGAEIGLKGRALLYKSEDFMHWVRAENPLHATNRSGMWECPDFYYLDGKERKYVLKMSLVETQSDNYVLGRYDKDKDVFLPDDTSDDCSIWLRYNYGKFYASKTFFDEKEKRRVLWGWVNESDNIADDLTKGWSGIQSIPRVVTLDPNVRQLVQWPVKELELLRRKQIDLHEIELKKGDFVEIKGLKTPDQADVEVEFELPNLETAEPFDANWVLDPPKLCHEKGSLINGKVGPFGLLVLASHDLKEYTSISFRVFKYDKGYQVLMCSDQRRSSLRAEVDKPTYGAFVDTDIKKDGKISLRTLIDHSVVESFGAQGKACITSRVYPTSVVRGDPHIFTFNNGSESVKISKLKAWNMAKARIS